MLPRFAAAPRRLSPVLLAAPLALWFSCVVNTEPIDLDGGAGGSTAGGSAAGGSAAGGSAAGGAAGGSAAGGSAAGGSGAGGSTAGGSAAGGSTAGGSAAGGSTAGGSAAGGSTAGGSAAGGSTAGGSAAGGSAGGGTAGGAPMNTAPVLGSLSPVTVNEGATTTVTLMATDAENDPLVFSIQNAPAFVSLAGAVLTIAPGFTHAGAHQVTVIVSDTALQSQGTLSITVVNVNRPPVLMPVAAVTMTAGTSQMVTFLATDPDGDAVSYSLTNAPPFGALVGNVLTLSPAANVVDSRMVTVTAADPSSATDSETFQLTVSAPANQPPALSMLTQVDAADMPVMAGGMVATAPQLRASVDDPENAQVRLEAEVVLSSATFTNTATHTGTLSAEGVLTLPLSSFAPGAYKWQLRALDAAGNASAWQQFNSGNAAFVLVAGSITGGLQVNGSAAATNNTNVTLTISASTTAPATVTELCYSNDGVSYVDCGAPVTMKAWALSAGDGMKTVRVRVRNSLNQTLVLNDSIILDTAPPQLSAFTVNANAAATNMATTSLSWTATDSLSGIATQQASNDGASFMNVSASPAVWMLGLTQGQVTVTLRVTDGAGNQATATDTIFYDTAVPTISTAVLNGGAGWTRLTAATLAVTAADGATSSGLFQVCVSGNVTPGCVPYGASVPVTLTGGNGLKTVLVTVSDNAGNVSLASMASIGLDQTAPNLSGFNVNSTAPYTNSANVSAFTFASDSGGSGLAQVQCQTDLGPFAPPVPHAPSVAYTLTGADGTKSVGCKVLDGAGNESPVAFDTIVLDRGAPTGTFVINAGNPAFTSSFAATLVFTASDPSGITHYCANTTGTPPSGPMDACFTPIASAGFMLPAGDGLKTVSVFFRDGANNVSTSAATDAITVDTVAPTVSVMGAGLGLAGGAASTSTLSPAFNHQASDATSGLGQVCTGDTSPPTTCVPWSAAPAVLLAAGDGPKTAYLRVIDAAGNPSAIVSDGITLDQTAPVVSGVSVNGGATYTNSVNVTVTSMASDAVGVTQLQVSTNGVGGFGAPAPYVSPVNATLTTGDGTKTVLLRVLDAAGNVSANGSDSIILDTTPPTVAISINSGARYTTTATVTVAFSPSESGSGLAQRCLKETSVGAPAPATPTAADSCFVLYTSTAMHTLAAQGDRRVYAWLLDGAGNVSTAAATYDIFLDSFAPTAPVGPASLAGHRQVTVQWTNSTDASSGVQGYEVGVGTTSGGPYQFGPLVTPGMGATTTLVLTLPNGVTHFFVVRAVDNAGNRSGTSTQVSATPRWPFAQQNRPASGALVRGIAYSPSANRYFTVGTAGALYSSDDGLVSFTRRDPMTDLHLNAVMVDGAGDVWTVGRLGHVARSTDDGVTFSVVANNDAAGRDLHAITFAGTTGSVPLVTSWWVAVGSNGRIVRASTTIFNAEPTFDVVTTSTGAHLRAVARCSSALGACSGAGVLVAVGTAGTVLRSTDNGATWTSVALPAGFTTQLNAVVALPNSNTIYIGGVRPTGQGSLLRSVDGAQSFSELPGFGDVAEIFALAATGTELWISGDTGTPAIIRFVGNTRSDATLPVPSSQNTDQLALVARSSTEVASAGYSGRMLLMTAPLTFTNRNVGTFSTFVSKLAMPSSYGSTLWGAGGSGLIVFSSNSGATWTQQGAGLTSNTINALAAFDTGGGVGATLLFGVGAAGGISKSTNGGTTWAADPDTGIVTASLNDVSCRTATSCLAVGAASTVLTWSGGNWVVTSTGGPRTFQAVAAWVSGGTNRAVVVGNAGALQTQSGATWTPRADINPSVDFRGVAAKSDGLGIVITVGTTGAIYKSTDHGVTFLPRPSGTTSFLEDVVNVPGTTTWYASGSGGVLLKSTDDGDSWSPLLTNTTDTLFSVAAGAVSTRVWAAGQSSTVIYSPTGGL
ncbi:MAG: hypothetical protein JNJ54_32715 [Myxococcaceae bacterium]|nr:hypothetical protein [Myxococcaceae bacterium]